MISKSTIFPLCKELKEKLKNEQPITKTEFQRFSVLFTKSLDWKDEKEWRLITLNIFKTKKNKGEPINVSLFKVPKASIKSITFGLRMCHEKKAEILNIVKSNIGYKNLIVRQAVQDKEDYKLCFIDL
jgi:hypothetical protein